MESQLSTGPTPSSCVIKTDLSSVFARAGLHCFIALTLVIPRTEQNYNPGTKNAKIQFRYLLKKQHNK